MILYDYKINGGIIMALNVKTKDSVIFGYLRELNATIPTYQRSYEWGQDQILDFLEDLYAEWERGVDSDSRYFFGPIITTEDENGLTQVIDGQQRLTTSTIFLAVLRDFVKSLTSVEDTYDLKGIIQRDLIGNGQAYYEYKLTQIGSIAEDFREQIQKDHQEKILKPKVLYSGKKSKGRGKVNNILRAYNQILAYLQDKTDSLTDQETYNFINEIFTVFTKQFFVVEISAVNRTEAFQIFQTINARGLDLSAADLIKSDFFGNSGENTEEVTQIWNRILVTLGDLNFSDFIRYSWNSKYNFTTARSLYKSVSKNINDSNKIIDFMKMLEKLSIPYSELNGDTEATYLIETDYGREALYILQELQELQFKTFQPLFLAAVNRNLSEKNMLSLIEASASILIRNKILNQGTNWLEKLFANLAQELNNSEEQTEKMVEAIINKLKSEQPNDVLISTKLSTYDFSNDTKLARYILRRIENNKEFEKGLVTFDNKKVHLEHIMPQSPADLSTWSVDEDTHADYLWKIGNLTLLLGSKNASVGNRTFETKKQGYSESDVRITRELIDYDQWDPSTIDARTEGLIQELLSL